MTTQDIENFPDEVIKVIKNWFKTGGFKDRKLTDTATDDFQVVNKKQMEAADAAILPTSGATGNVLTWNGTSWVSSSLTFVSTLIPFPNAPLNPAATTAGQNKLLNSNTTFYTGMIEVPFKITANEISILVNNINVNGTYTITLYPEDGQTQIFTITTATISSPGVITTALSAVVIPAGNYYIGITTNGTASMNVVFWDTTNVGLGTGTGYLGDAVVNKAVLEGSFAITASTPPANFLPYTNVLYHVADTLMFRLDT